MKRPTLFLLLALIIGFSANAQDKVSFDWKPPVGEKLNYLTSIHMDVQSEQSVLMDITMNMEQEFMAKDAEGLYPSVGVIKSIKVDMNVGFMTMSYDSENPDDTNPMAQQIGEQFSKVLHKEIRMKYAATGEVVDVESEGDLSMLGDVKGMFGGAVFPKQPVAVGESWETEVENEQIGATLVSKMTYAGIENGLVRVNVSASTKDGAAAGITAEGFNLYDPQTFNIVKTENLSRVTSNGVNITNKTVMEKQ